MGEGRVREIIKFLRQGRPRIQPECQLWALAVELHDARSVSVLQNCSIKRSLSEQAAKTGCFSSPSVDTVDAKVIDLQSTIHFPSWTSRVRIPSPAPCFQRLGNLFGFRRYCDYCDKLPFTSRSGWRVLPHPPAKHSIPSRSLNHEEPSNREDSPNCHCRKVLSNFLTAANRVLKSL